MNAQPGTRTEKTAIDITTDLLRHTHHTRVYEVAHESALDEASLLSARLGVQVLLKREDQQPGFSFKLRGAYNRMVRLTPAQRAHGVIAASAGNHAQGVALASAKLGIHALIIMPVTAPQVKIDAVRRFGGHYVEIMLTGNSYSDAQVTAAQLQGERGSVFIHPFDDFDVIAGQATVGLELLRQCPKKLHAVFVPVGGGGLLGGIATCIKANRPEVKIIGVQAADSDAMARSLETQTRIKLDEVGLFTDGTAVKQVGALTFALCQRHVDTIVRVDTDTICAAIRDIYQENRSITEPAGALALAGLKHYANTHANIDGALVAVVSGANMNFNRLRFIAERVEVGEEHEALFAVIIPEERGSFRRFCNTIGQHAITELNYRMGHTSHAHLFVGVQVTSHDERNPLVSAFQAQGFDVLDLTDDELAKRHLRHMLGGHAAPVDGERLYCFEFPERPGALSRFLHHMQPNWNISLFDYHNQGADYGHILVGIQVPADEIAALQYFLDTLGYPHRDQSEHPAYRRLLRA